jgi:hypothetical protein
MLAAERQRRPRVDDEFATADDEDGDDTHRNHRHI